MNPQVYAVCFVMLKRKKDDDSDCGKDQCTSPRRKSLVLLWATILMSRSFWPAFGVYVEYWEISLRGLLLGLLLAFELFEHPCLCLWLKQATTIIN